MGGKAAVVTLTAMDGAATVGVVMDALRIAEVGILRSILTGFGVVVTTETAGRTAIGLIMALLQISGVGRGATAAIAELLLGGSALWQVIWSTKSRRPL